jgi:ADP-ribose pyrophosphatase
MEDGILAEGKYRRFVRREGWEFTERYRSNQVVVMIALTPDRKLVFVEQYRVPVQSLMIEFPAGLVNDNESNSHEGLEETARRELLEETGYEGQNFQFIRQDPANAAVASDMLHVFFVSGLKKVGPGGGDETEKIKVHEVPLLEVDRWLETQKAAGKLVDLKIFAGLYYLKHLVQL